jgi:hypothetical protein
VAIIPVGSMYRSFTDNEYRRHVGLPDDYRVDGFLVYGTFKTYPYEQFTDSLHRLECSYNVCKKG